MREEQEHEESRIAAVAIRSRSHGGGGLKSDLESPDGLGHIPSGPNVSDTRIQHKMCLHFQDTSGNVSEAYPYWKRVGYGYAAY